MFLRTLGGLLASVLLSIPSFAASFDELMAEAGRVTHEYDLAAGAELIDQMKPIVDEDSSDEQKLTLASVALMVAELRRMEYETTDAEPREKRLLGRTIDDAAETGLRALKTATKTSERWRIRADLYGTMIRSKFKGKKYGGEMDKATEKALELDPKNANAIVTGSKRALFAKPSQGGDVPKALEMLNEALDLDPNHERALIFRGIAYEKLGNDDQAEVDWKQALQLNPHSRLAKENLQSMEKATD